MRGKSDASTGELTDECVETHEYARVCKCELHIFKKIYMGMKKLISYHPI